MLDVDTPADTVDTGVETVEDTVDEGGAPESASTPEQTTEEPLSIDDLLNADLQEYEEFQAEDTHKGMAPLSSIMAALDAPVRKHLANIRRDYSNKTKELAAARKEIEAERAKVQAEREKFLNSDVYKRVQELANTDLEGVDLYSDEGIRKAIEKQAAELMQQQLRAYQEQVEAERSQHQVATLKEKYADDLKDEDIRAELINVSKRYPEMDLEEAIILAKQKAAPARELRLQELQAKEQERVRKGLLKTSTGKGQQLSVPDFNAMSSTEVASYLSKLSPEERAQAMKIHKSRKRGY